MKKLLSFILALVMMLTIGGVNAFADGLDGFVVDVFNLDIIDNGTKITLSWDKVKDAEYYEVYIDSSNEFFGVREKVTETSYNWVPDGYVTPYDKFVIIVYAYDNENSTIAESNVCNVSVMPYNCDYIGMYGDIDEDKNPSVIDATLIQMYLAQTYDFSHYQEKKADADNDSVISIVDATCVQLFCAGIYNEVNATGQTFWYGTLEFDVIINSEE